MALEIISAPAGVDLDDRAAFLPGDVLPGFDLVIIPEIGRQNFLHAGVMRDVHNDIAYLLVLAVILLYADVVDLAQAFPLLFRKGSPRGAMEIGAAAVHDVHSKAFPQRPQFPEEIAVEESQVVSQIALEKPGEAPQHGEHGVVQAIGLLNVDQSHSPLKVVGVEENVFSEELQFENAVAVSPAQSSGQALGKLAHSIGPLLVAEEGRDVGLPVVERHLGIEVGGHKVTAPVALPLSFTVS